MMRILCFLFVFFSANYLLAGEIIHVGLFTASSIKEVEIKCASGSLILEASSSFSLETASANSVIKCLAYGREILVYINDYKIGEFSELRFISGSSGFMHLKPSKPSLNGNHYSGIVHMKAKDGKLKLINEVSVDDYLTGVLRGEIGFNKPPVVYEVHAIISRTYAKRFGDKHKSEGFHVCDQTHCQVYKGYFEYEPYKYSIELTKNIIMYDSVHQELAEGLFHSNCGGVTSNSEDVWSASLSYCRSKRDTFCLNGTHSNWTFNVNKNDFFERLQLDSNSVSCEDICYFSDSRANKLTLGKRSFETTTIRNLFKLKSSFFSWECDGDVVRIYGKGFGHGVGLCQEGAIEMAGRCFSAEEIIKYYYKDISIRIVDSQVP